MASDLEAARSVVEPVLAALGLDLYDLEISGAAGGRTLRVTVDREGGVDLDAVTEATGAVSARLDDAALDGPYLLEVSSPGVERALRVPAHYHRAQGSTVTVKYRGESGTRRLQGTLTVAGEEGCTIEVEGVPHEVAYSDITSARTIFEWGPAPRPTGGRSGGARRRVKERSRS